MRSLLAQSDSDKLDFEPAKGARSLKVTAVKRFAIANGDWTQGYTADSYWTALRTIRDQPPDTMAGLATLALRVRASRQLSGVIQNLNCDASSILPDYNTVTRHVE